MATNQLDRVQLLMNLTDSPHEEEARTSAVLAMRMIRKYGFKIVDRTHSDGPSLHSYEGPSPRRGREELKEMAWAKVERLHGFLEKKAWQEGEYAVFSARQLAERSAVDGHIHHEDSMVFEQYLRVWLRTAVVQGRLESVRGWGGGYRLRGDA